MAADPGTLAVHGQVVSDTPGRLRVRLHPSARSTTVMHRLQEHVEDKPGIDSVETKSSTGSLLVQYDPNRWSIPELLDLLYEAGLVLHDVLTEETPELPAASHSDTAVGIINTTDRLDRKLSMLTGQKVDLKMVVPLTVGGIGLFKVMRDGLQLAEIPGYILIWYAFDMFFKFHTVPDRGGVPPAVQAAADNASSPGG
jgi:heavy-metal-associated domain-containing protein